MYFVVNSIFDVNTYSTSMSISVKSLMVVTVNVGVTFKNVRV